MKNKTNGWRFKGNEIKYLKEVLDTDFKAKLSSSKNEKLEKLLQKHIIKNLQLQLTQEQVHYIWHLMPLELDMEMK